ncbi:uncharacterized protein LOC6530134 [Drosophila yakuba]|uniref:Uncharacterized protein n=1 Tax=Drosophila yakuba TaxID=7245 RepID=B4P5D0_DROYA|nr:uncharacterized protein LOC6530134 [Drosophila yakuba]EDW90792.1 uncharacterized protein Dyak_GE13456 [Drosophila yakuba]
MATLRNHNSAGGGGNHSNHNGQDSPQAPQDAVATLAIGYVREFRMRVATFQTQRSEESLVYVQRSVALLSTKVQPAHFAPTPGNLELARFYVDLHALMGALENEGAEDDVLWACVGLVQCCSRNLEARQAIVEKFCFVPLLGVLIRRTKRTERVHRLLVLLQDLTYGIHIAWEEPYLAALIEHLVGIVLSTDDGSSSASGGSIRDDDDSQALLALSVLVNLCYKNFAVLFLFLRSVNISAFCSRIQNYGLLAYKMLIILSEDVYAFEQSELCTFLRMSFAGIEDCLKHWNVAQLRHIVDFLLDSQCHAGLHRAMLSHGYFCTDVEKLLNQIDARSGMDDSQEETRKHQQISLGLVFRLVSYILLLSEDANSCISLDAITPRLYEMVGDWLGSDQCGVAAIELLCTLLRLGKREAVAQMISRDPSHLVSLVASAERPDTKPGQVLATLRLLIALLQETKTEKLVLSKVSESYFDKILAAPLALVPQFLSTQSLAQSEVEKACFCLLLLVNVAGIAKKAYLDKCCTLLEQPQLQYCLARGMVSRSEALVGAVLQIAQFEHFPKAAVAKHVAAITSSPSGAMAGASAACSDQVEQWRNLSSILKGHRTFTDKDMAQRVNALLDSIGGIVRRNELASAPVSQVIELYNHRIDSLNGAVVSLQQRLDQAGQQLVSGTQLAHVQSAELERFQSTNFELLISQERLQTQCKDLKQQTVELKSNMTNLLKQMSENSVHLQASERRLLVKKSEIAELQKDCEELRTNLSAKTEELTKLEAHNKENTSRIDKLKKSMVAYEQDMTEKLRTIGERDRELAKTHKALEEQREACKKSEDLISVLETQLQERKDQIENLEMEQKETEDLRKTIMSLMESKKPKRKA